MDEFKKNLRQSTGLRIFVYLVSLAICSLMAEGLILSLAVDDNINLLKIGQGIGSILMFIVPPLVLYAVAYDKPLQEIGFRPIDDLWILLIGLALMFVSLPVTNQLTTWNEGMQLPASLKPIEDLLRQMEEQAGSLTDRMLQVDSLGGLLFNLLVIALIPAIGEELTFRGVMQQWLVRSLKNPHVAILLSSAIFSFIHLQFYGFLPRMFLGMLLGYLFYYSGSIWVSIAMHFLNNGSAVVIAFLEHKGVIETTPEDFGATSNVALIVGSLVLTIALVWFSRYRSKQRQGQMIES